MTTGWRIGLVLALLAAGCAGRLDTVELTPRGPTAEDLFVARSQAINGRAPSFDEKRQWSSQVEDRVFAYLREHPELQQTSRYSDFRFWWQVTTGSTPAEVRVLLEEPHEQTIDPARMAALADRHWNGVRPRATEAWVYEPAWTIYFDDRGVVGMVHRVSALDTRD
ncbi:MAG TPA: hypothetical protein VGT40_03590 [Methylomirabilota bacterium]|jgi:hypothetical protein|nr:hypothetical protein [Methylomirabilota bacterium]